MMRKSMVVAVALVVGALVAKPAAAQTVDVEWARQFVGSWDVRLDTPDGEVPLVLTVEAEGGAVVVILGRGEQGQRIEEVRRSGETLVASYEMTYQGMALPATVTLKRDGTTLQTSWSFAEGMYETSAPASRR